MDRRQQKTRMAIFNAFEMLLTQKNYNKITVRDIIDAANVGRTTFYAHFQTKDDLLEELCTSLFNHVFAQYSDPECTHNFSFSEGETKDIVTHILYHLKEKGNNIARLLTGESSDIFLSYFKSYLDEMLAKYLLSGMLHENSRIPESFLRNHISGSFVNMVQWWFARGRKESPEELADYFLSVIEPVL